MKKIFSRSRFGGRIASRCQKKCKGKRFKAACLALGLATAWGGEANADLMLRVEVTPTQTLNDAYVYYGNNVSTGLFMPLGTLPVNQTSVFNHVFESGNSLHQFMDQPEKIAPENGVPIGYFIGGLYDEGGAPGMTLSFPDTSPIDLMQSWTDLFPLYTEQEIIDDFVDGIGFFDSLGGFVGLYGDNNYLGNDDPLPTPYGEEATLISFSEATFAGTAVVTIVPEPCTTMLLVTGTGIILLASRKRTET